MDATTRRILTMIPTLTPGWAWMLLLVAGLLEVVWTGALKASNGFTNPAYTAVSVLTSIVSFALLGITLKSLPVGTAYAVWTGVGAVGAAVLGMWLFGEAATTGHLLCIALIVVGIAGLKLFP